MNRTINFQFFFYISNFHKKKYVTPPITLFFFNIPSFVIMIYSFYHYFIFSSSQPKPSIHKKIMQKAKWWQNVTAIKSKHCLPSSLGPILPKREFNWGLLTVFLSVLLRAIICILSQIYFILFNIREERTLLR